MTRDGETDAQAAISAVALPPGMLASNVSTEGGLPCSPSICSLRLATLWPASIAPMANRSRGPSFRGERQSREGTL